MGNQKEAHMAEEFDLSPNMLRKRSGVTTEQRRRTNWVLPKILGVANRRFCIATAVLFLL